MLVRCKKDLDFEDRIFYAGNDYEWHKGQTGGAFVLDETNTEKVPSGLWFSLDDRDIYTNRFSDYFYTVKEMRKKKLKKLNERRK